ncbi:DNA-nicking endonuclease, Smr domain [Pseudoxanthobacter soli DSM 19599]|uniref:DNA-nicking endonuclease, Smr domain n=1 Tax=Pseudoxanthobacter soli DSM 19599 TaxID=1123029 RepID=A0A1M7ZJE5_9HYPH|nr:Smr/MutS family protein [Pseudoxanthobacter soli]SHO65014.1 DNA-nicking endonuclease, Smr domain [Pseudoxanthobacter soli DSM 19599]
MSGRGRRRGLTEEDRALWERLAATVEPLPQKRGRHARQRDAAVAPDAAGEAEASPPRALPSTAPPGPVAAGKPLVSRPKPPPMVPLERRAVRRLKSGRSDVEDRLDLHGMTQEAAKARLMAFLARAQAGGLKTVLVITGKGGGSVVPLDFAEPERGILRRMVPLWLAMPAARALVVGYSEATISHGGSGALYVTIRRPRP